MRKNRPSARDGEKPGRRPDTGSTSTRRPPLRGPDPTSGRAVLRVSGLSVTRGGHPILDKLDWTVAPGEHWAILGANGSGKTSLLSALTGYLTPTRGEVELLGQRYGHANWPALRRRVGLVSSALRQLIHEDEPALEIVVGGRYAAIDVRDRPRPKDIHRAERLLCLVGCPVLGQRPWAYLSQGERQRTLIARALMAQPDLLILDEPCAGLDPIARERFLEFMGCLALQAMPSLVLVTHHIEEIIPCIAHALVLRAGKVAAAGPTARVLTSRTLSAAFDERVEVQHRDGRFRLRVPAARGGTAWSIRRLPN